MQLHKHLKFGLAFLSAISPLPSFAWFGAASVPQKNVVKALSKTTSKAPAYALGGLIGLGVGYVAWKYLKKQTAKTVPVKQLNELGKEVADPLKRMITSYVITDFEKLTYKDREKLLPAIIRIEKNKLKNYLLEYREKCKEAYISYSCRPENERAWFQQNGHRALYGYLHYNGTIKDDKEELIGFSRRLHEYQLKNPSQMFLKNKTKPHEMLLRPIGAGEFALVGYTDGDIQILLNDSDRRLLKNLSDEQCEFIKGIYVRNSWDSYLSPEDTKIFKSLPKEVQANLMFHHDFRLHRKARYSDQDQVIKNTVGAAAIYAMIERMRHVPTKENYIRFPATALMLYGFIDQLNAKYYDSHTSESAKEEAWKIPLFSSVLLEMAIKLGYHITSK